MSDYNAIRGIIFISWYVKNNMAIILCSAYITSSISIAAYREEYNFRYFSYEKANGMKSSTTEE